MNLTDNTLSMSGGRLIEVPKILFEENKKFTGVNDKVNFEVERRNSN